MAAIGFLMRLALATSSAEASFLHIVPGLRVRLLSDEVSFMEAFQRFPDDELNGISPVKLERLGQEAIILASYHDNTVTCRFDDGAQHDMPIEAIEPTAGGGVHESQVGVKICATVCMHAHTCAHGHMRSCMPPNRAMARGARLQVDKTRRQHISLPILSSQQY